MPCLIPLRRILNLADPVSCPPWECGLLLSKQDVLDAIAKRDWLVLPVAESEYGNPFAHARRIAYLVEHGWEDPVEIDVGVPSLGCLPLWPVLDGNHRIYAAVVRADADIFVSVAGDLGYAAHLFGVSAKLLEERATD
jgi:hypothetical protein